MSAETIRNWELGRSRPGFRQTPQAADFLGRFMLFRPGKPLDFPVRLQLVRSRLGLSQAELAARLGVDGSSVWGWENGHHRPSPKHLGTLERLIEAVAPATEGR